jgi:O-methyltransferase involved in polyketide biosynthesis
MEIDNIEITKKKETLFITLYAKSMDYQSRKSVLNDKTAYDIINSLNCDFKMFKGLGGKVTVIRTKQIDNWVNDFINKYQNTVVLNLGCGLDARINRINPQKSVIWYDIDFPEVIKIRKKYFYERKGYNTLETSITEDNWYKNIPKEYPTIITADGVLEYLTKDEIKILFERLFNYFSNGEIIFDIMSSYAVKAGKNGLKETTGAEHKWLVDNIYEIDDYNKKLKRINDISIFESSCIKDMDIGIKIFCKIALMAKKYKNMLRILKYEY